MSHVASIALNTFRESVRSKILFSIFFFAIVLVLVSALFGTVTIGDQVKVIKDFGLLSVSLFSVSYAVISGSSLLYKELAQKTIYNILAKPVHRWQFLLGKYLGMLMTVGVMVALMGLALSGFVMLFEGRLDVLLFQAYLFILFELAIVCAATIFFSSIVVTPILIGLFTFGVFLTGRSAEYLLYFVKEGSITGVLASVLEALYVIMPHLDILNPSNEIVYGDIVSLEHTLYAAAYSAGYAGALLMLANWIFLRREFN